LFTSVRRRSHSIRRTLRFECGLIHIPLLVLRVLDMKCERPLSQIYEETRSQPRRTVLVLWFGWLVIVKIDWAVVESFHNVKGLAPGACGNQQSGSVPLACCRDTETLSLESRDAAGDGGKLHDESQDFLISLNDPLVERMLSILDGSEGGRVNSAVRRLYGICELYSFPREKEVFRIRTILKARKQNGHIPE